MASSSASEDRRSRRRAGAHAESSNFPPCSALAIRNAKFFTNATVRPLCMSESTPPRPGRRALRPCGGRAPPRAQRGHDYEGLS
ncbi:hypothetical protein GUJ93_ZPchr0012g19219 [Zizania palustris]|uniref:Uncharacterized protein n=1 Tax=Zizania palustris TaxID=103762 RepID=A0A8J6BVY0_ZIZPA|nr:hypothetical protein GUJ93_ZPchr0012g19219 [Zizania palustris]